MVLRGTRSGGDVSALLCSVIRWLGRSLQNMVISLRVHESLCVLEIFDSSKHE